MQTIILAGTAMVYAGMVFDVSCSRKDGIELSIIVNMNVLALDFVQTGQMNINGLRLYIWLDVVFKVTVECMKEACGPDLILN